MEIAPRSIRGCRARLDRNTAGRMGRAMTDNMRHWTRFADVDPKFTKAITGKQYKGTSPNPQYVIRCLTEIFGPVGVGFGWRVLVEGFEPLGEKTLHWCRVEFWHTDRTHTFESYGQTVAAYPTNSGGFMVDEDAPKKSLTDAIIKAASHVGIAANIFLGRWDDQKHVAQVNAEYRAEENAAKPQPAVKSQPVTEPKRQAPRNDDAAFAAVVYLGGSDTDDDLMARWRNLPDDIKADQRVIDAGAKARKDLKLAATAAQIANPHLGNSAIPY